MKKLIFGWLILLPAWSFAQNKYEAEIRAFEQQDRQMPPPVNPILFTGSSSIRFWTNLPAYFPGKVVLNRGFGGSELSDVIQYADRIIIRYKPKQVVLYAGENDIATGKQTGRQTYKRFVTLFRQIRLKLPTVRFTYISIKPSPSRRNYFAEIDLANRLIKRYLKRQRNTQFVDIRPVMLQPNGPSGPGQPVGALFKSDSLHMTELGYQRWAKVLGPYLE